jgi:hypothetical protein
MVKFVKGALLAVVASFALASVASAQPELTDAEFKCQGKVSKAGSKFVAAKAKCASKCIQLFRKNVPGDGYDDINDCYAPYGDATAKCIVTDPLKPGKSAEEKFAAAIKKSCDLATKPGADCPECYSGGDCSDAGEAGDRVQNVEVQVDNFGPSVFCEQPGADDAETKCELTTAKTLGKLVGAINKCYDKCNSNMRKDVIADGECTPPTPNDQTTTDCLTKARDKAVLGIDKKCTLLAALPDCTLPDDYPDGAAWVGVVDLAIQGNVPGTYCNSPSGAFVD